MDADPESALRAIPCSPGSGLFVIQDGEVQVELSGRALMHGPGDFFERSPC